MKDPTSPMLASRLCQQAFENMTPQLFFCKPDDDIPAVLNVAKSNYIMKGVFPTSPAMASKIRERIMYAQQKILCDNLYKKSQGITTPRKPSVLNGKSYVLI